MKTVLASPRLLGRLWREDHRTLLHELMLFFIGSGFILPNEPVWSDVFYIGIIPLFIVTACRGGLDVRWRTCPAPLVAAAGILVSFLVSTVVNVSGFSQAGRAFFWTGNIACTAIFVFLLADAFATRTDYRNRLITLMIGAGMINITISLILRLGFQSLEWQGDILRMQGWGLTRHPILGAVIMGGVLLKRRRSAPRGVGECSTAEARPSRCVVAGARVGRGHCVVLLSSTLAAARTAGTGACEDSLGQSATRADAKA